jgi:hypothetical protein
VAPVKIAVFDPNVFKFTQGMIDSWVRDGHEVRQEVYYNPELVRWADTVFFYTCDNNLNVASHGMSDHPDWAMDNMDLTGKKIIVRCIDIECWLGHHKNARWDLVTDVIFNTDHIRELVTRDIDFAAKNVKVHQIQEGVDMDRFTFVDKPIGKKIAWVCEKWPTKGIDLALQIMAMLPLTGYELHTIGGWNDRYEWERAYQEDFILRNGINFIDHGNVPDVNEWLADKDFILSCSKKEAFGYNIAEGMAKGLIPVIHNFYGAKDIWGEFTWETVDQAVELITMVTQQQYRAEVREDLVRKGYTLEHMMERLNREVLQCSTPL